MKKREALLRILILVVCWGVGGYLCGEAMVFWGVPRFSVVIAMGNVILGLVLLLMFTRDPRLARYIYHGPEAQERDSDMLSGCFWGLTVMVPVVGLLWWLGSVLTSWFSHR